MLKLWLDDLRPAPVGWAWAKTYEEALSVLEGTYVTDASFDHDLGYGLLPEDTPGEYFSGGTFIPDAKYDNNLKTGYDLVRKMVELDLWPVRSLAVHSANPVGAAAMCGTIERYGPYEKKDHVVYEHSPCGGHRYYIEGEVLNAE